jgi:hypothetical protein
MPTAQRPEGFGGEISGGLVLRARPAAIVRNSFSKSVSH